MKAIKLVIEVAVPNLTGQRQAQELVHSWLSTYGHTATGHGFEFISVGVLTGKRLPSAPSISDRKR